jgi:hypothetical protein
MGKRSKFDIRPAVESLGLDRFIEQVGLERLVEQMGKKELLKHFSLDEILTYLSPAQRRELKRRLQE